MLLKRGGSFGNSGCAVFRVNIIYLFYTDCWISLIVDGVLYSGMSWDLVECPMGAVLMCTVLKDVMLSLGFGCYCPSLLYYIIMSLKEFAVRYLDGFMFFLIYLL